MKSIKRYLKFDFIFGIILVIVGLSGFPYLLTQNILNPFELWFWIIIYFLVLIGGIYVIYNFVRTNFGICAHKSKNCERGENLNN